MTALAAGAETQVIRAPVQMYAEGQPLRFGSLYPPKPIAFRTGKEYFVAVGHGEALVGGHISPDAYRLDKRHDTICDRQIADKQIAIELLGESIPPINGNAARGSKDASWPALFRISANSGEIRNTQAAASSRRLPL